MSYFKDIRKYCLSSEKSSKNNLFFGTFLLVFKNNCYIVLLARRRRLQTLFFVTVFNSLSFPTLLETQNWIIPFRKPCIHLPEISQNRVYTKPCIHPFSSENRVYILRVYTRIRVYIYTLFPLLEQGVDISRMPHRKNPFAGPHETSA